MEKFVLGLFLFYALAAVCRANSFKCYQCIPKGDSYSKDQCEKDQKEVDCDSTWAGGMPVTCMKTHAKNFTDDNEVESRACVRQKDCHRLKKVCDDEDSKEKAVDWCVFTCCQTDLCNSGVATFAKVAIIMMGSLCVFMVA